MDHKNISTDTATAVLDTCIRLRGTNDFRSTIKDVIRGIRDLCEAEHCCILVMNEYNRSCYVLGEAFAEGSKLLPMDTYVDDEFYDIAESWESTIAGGSCFIGRDQHDMNILKERNPVWYESLTAAGVHNIVLFPLRSREQLLGYMWALNFDQDMAGSIRDTLEITTFIVASELGNYILLDRLRLLSSKDMLTGVMNRNEMNNYVDSLSHSDESGKQSVGVIFADINGLKAINDLEGHTAGDLLLKNAANALREVFEEKYIFRAGGDEFAIILTGISRDDLNEKIGKIRKACEKYRNVIFAIGGSLEEDSRNVRVALRAADENMYEDKRLFYSQDPELMKDSRMGRTADTDVTGKFRERSLFREMNYDHLTGLPSMTYFFKLAEIGRNNMHCQDIPSAVVFMDFKGMRYFNTKNGFAEGDVLIKGLADILSGMFGEENCSRFGQDHFAVFTKAEDLQDRLKKVFRDARHLNGGKSLPLRAGIYLDSMGLVEASLACDRAKFASKAREETNSSYYNYYDDKMLSKELNRQYIVDNLDRAIGENWIQAFYQPIVRTMGRKVCDEEALARWIDPEKGMLSPADFIPILEETKLIYKVDLHILDIILERLKNAGSMGLTPVPVSINLSRTDFESCDIVEEINNRVEASGVPKDFITIEITESVVGENFDYMKERITRFQDLGFKVWMDDFGSGYSSLDLLQEMQFDLIKFDMRFMRQFETTPKSRIILTELMRMAQSLGIETVCEGVETAEQADFLNEIGCTKMQGYFFCKPIPLKEILNRYKNGIQIGFEDPNETPYQKTIGSINMYNLSSVSNDEAEISKHYFDTVPMAVIEYDNGNISVIRSNKSYREFINRYFNDSIGIGPMIASDSDDRHGMGLIGAIKNCQEAGGRTFLNEKMNDGSTIHAMIKKLVDNPVRNVSAYAVVVLDITPEDEQNLTYASVAQALSSDYLYLYYVDTETDQFVEYSPSKDGRGISAERRGDNFFEQSRNDAMTYLYPDDREQFTSLFTKEKVMSTVDDSGVFVHKYRLMINDVPTFVNMKIVRMDNKHIIIGVNNVDSQMRQQEAIERLQEEKTTYSRISALMGDFIAIYTVDPESGNYMQYSASRDYSELATSKAGIDFFEDSIRDSRGVIYDEDLDYFMTAFSKEKILEKTKDGGVYNIHYRLMINSTPTWISLRAGMVQEKDGPQLIVGVSVSSDSDTWGG